MTKTIAVIYVDSPSPRTYDYLLHPSVGEVKRGDVLWAEARDTTALVEVKAVHVTPSRYASKFAFQKVQLRPDGTANRPVDMVLLTKIRNERASSQEQNRNTAQ